MLKDDSFLANTALHRLLIGALALAYGLAVLTGMDSPVAGAALSAVALVALGAAVAAHTSARLPQVTPRVLGGRARAAQRRYRALALVTLGAVYLVLAFGVLMVDRSALWECLALPVCPAPNQPAQLALAHRIMAALAVALVALLAVQTWRRSSVRAARVAAAWVLGLIVVQVLIGLGQVLLALDGNGTALLVVRGAHLACGVAAWGALVVQTTLALRLPLDLEDTPGVAPIAYSSKLKDYISLTKPGVITLLIFTTLAGMLITPAGLPSLGLVFWTLLGGWLMPSGAHALNCYFDRDIDVLMGRTGRRPLPSNRIPAWHALALGLTLGALAFAILAMFVNMAAALLALAGYFYYVVIYTLWLKRSSFNNIVIGGGAGAFPPLVGWAAVTGGLTLPALFLFAIIFYWTPPHFWALALIRQKDYARAGVPMLPVVAGDEQTRWQILLYTVLLFTLTIMPVPLGMLGLPYLALALLFNLLLLRYVIRLWRDGTTGAAWSLYKFSLLYLALLFGAMVADRVLVG